MRYYVKYSGDFDDELTKIPSKGRHIDEIRHLYEKRNCSLKKTDIGVDKQRHWLDIHMTPEEAAYARSQGLDVYERPELSGQPLFEPDGVTFGNQKYCNKYSKVENINGYLYNPPFRKDYFPGDSIFEWNQPNSRGTVLQGKIIQPTHLHLGIDKLWAEGLTGDGVKIGVLDTGIAVGAHIDAPVVESYNPLLDDNIEIYTDTHAVGRVSQYVANTNLKGICPGATVYAATYTTFTMGFLWLISKGVDIINMSFTAGNDPYFDELVSEFTSNGGIVVAAGGNSAAVGAETQINPVCSLRDVIGVGSTIGGSIYKFENKIYYKSVLPINSKGLMFVAPCSSIDASTGPDGTINSTPYYQSGTRGSSMSAPVVGGILALFREKFRNLGARTLIEYVERYHTITTIDGYKMIKIQ